MIKAVIFDMDGLLIDSEPFWHKAEKAAFKTVGVDIPKAGLLDQMGTRVDEVVAYRYHLQPWEGVSQKDIEAMIVDQVVASIKKQGVPKPGVIQVLEFFKSAGVPMAVASSSLQEVIDTVMGTLKISHYFDHVHSAEHESHGKPHPDVYVSTAGLLQVLPHEILVFEDAPNGVLAAKAAKMRCIAVPAPIHREHKFVKTADLILGSLEDFNSNMLSSF